MNQFICFGCKEKITTRHEHHGKAFHCPHCSIRYRILQDGTPFCPQEVIYMRRKSQPRGVLQCCKAVFGFAGTV